MIAEQTGARLTTSTVALVLCDSTRYSDFSLKFSLLHYLESRLDVGDFLQNSQTLRFCGVVGELYPPKFTC